jgi:hypothetical protein
MDSRISTASRREAETDGSYEVEVKFRWHSLPWCRVGLPPEAAAGTDRT